MKMLRNLLPGILFGLSIAFIGGCQTEPKPEGLSQMATIDSLLVGVYDGTTTLKELKKHGNFGIGTFDRLDGELILFEGEIYQVRADGKIYRPDDNVTTPFASVLMFEPNLSQPVMKTTNLDELYQLIDKMVPNRNIFLAIHLRGNFTSVKTRSVPAQEKPYPPLAEVAKRQPEFEFSAVGDIIGFRLPDFVKGINVPGYHLHFISHDRKQGGHLLDMNMTAGRIQLEEIDSFHLYLPDSASFAEADLSKDRSVELKLVEGSQLKLLPELLNDKAHQWTEAQNGKSITLAPNERVVLKLPANPSTGYLWKIILTNQPDGTSQVPEVVRQTGEKFTPANEQLAGAPGESEYTFRAIRPGGVTLLGYYYRPWEPLDPEEDCKLQINITVQ